MSEHTLGQLSTPIARIAAKHGLENRVDCGPMSDGTPPTFYELHEMANASTAEDNRRLTHYLLDVVEELQRQHVHLRNEFARLYETSVPVVTDAMRKAGRFLRKGKHINKPHEWVVANDPQYVVYCDDKSAALALGFTEEEVQVARIALRDNPSLRDRMYAGRRDAAIARATKATP